MRYSHLQIRRVMLRNNPRASVAFIPLQFLQYIHVCMCMPFFAHDQSLYLHIPTCGQASYLGVVLMK